MSLDQILCLANSYKHENRCVAGISLVTKQWVRLVGKRVSGCLTKEEACYADGRPSTLLDVFEAELGERCGTDAHPEDVYVANRPWRWVRRFDETVDPEFPYAFLDEAPTVLQGYCDRIPALRFARTPPRLSLALIRPKDLWWWIREENGRRKNRAVFYLGRQGHIHYDLPLTDPAWLDQLALLPCGIYRHSLLCGDKPVKTYLTISLSEAFQGFHYKLVAGVVNLPE